MKRSPQDKKKRSMTNIATWLSKQGPPDPTSWLSMPSPANNCQAHPIVTTFPQSSTQILATAHWLSSSGYSVGNVCKFPKLDTLHTIWIFVTDTYKRC